jgi:FtsP/CotA-like multicopper oxidase with cupredoxin domain
LILLLPGPVSRLTGPRQCRASLRIPFLDVTGTFVSHCHILAHQDLGRMSVIEVVE